MIAQLFVPQNSNARPLDTAHQTDQLTSEDDALPEDAKTEKEKEAALKAILKAQKAEKEAAKPSQTHQEDRSEDDIEYEEVPARSTLSETEDVEDETQDDVIQEDTKGPVNTSRTTSAQDLELIQKMLNTHGQPDADVWQHGQRQHAQKHQHVQQRTQDTDTSAARDADRIQNMMDEGTTSKSKTSVTTSRRDQALIEKQEKATATSVKRKPQQSVKKQNDAVPFRERSTFQEMPTDDTAQASTYVVANQPETRDFIKSIAEDAHWIGQKENIYASVMIAQAILESDSGRSGLAKSPNNNLFGVKGQHKGQSAEFNTLEADASGDMYQISAQFRKYDSKGAALKDYATLMTKGLEGAPDFYKPTWKSEAEDFETATAFLVGKYATDPDYDKKLNSIIKQYRLYELDEPRMPELDDMFSQAAEDTDTDDVVEGYKPFKEVDALGAAYYPYGQCTWYVYNRMQQYGDHIALTMGNGGEWGYNAMARGYETSSTPKRHTAVSFKPGQAGADATYGHVAFVEDVRDDGSIVVSESNVKGLGVISHRIISSEDAAMLTYIKGQ